MQRQPLQLVNNNIQRSGFPIFDDFKGKPVSKPRVQLQPHASKSTSRTDTGTSNNLAKALYMVVLLQRNELKLATLRSYFMKLVNYSLSCKLKKTTQPAGDTRPVSSKPSATPKKRRLDDENAEDVENIPHHDVRMMGTPPRIRGANVSRATTPHNSTTKRASSTPYQSRSAAGTPGRPPMADLSNKVNRSLMEEEKNVLHKDTTVEDKVPPAVSLSERLEMVEASLQKLKTMETQSASRAANIAQRSPLRAPAPSGQPSAAQASRDVPSTESSSTGTSSSVPSETIESAGSAPSGAAVAPLGPSPVPVAATFAGRGSSLHKPLIAEHDILQAAIQRATKASIKTLLKSREALPQSSELKDKLHTYQQDSAKVDASLKPAVPANSPRNTNAQVHTLEVAIINYHHGTSDLFPLSPLGDQSIRGASMAPVPLPAMSILADKMQSWKTKYTTRPAEKKA